MHSIVVGGNLKTCWEHGSEQDSLHLKLCKSAAICLVEAPECTSRAGSRPI